MDQEASGSVIVRIPGAGSAPLYLCILLGEEAEQRDMVGRPQLLDAPDMTVCPPGRGSNLRNVGRDKTAILTNLTNFHQGKN